MSKPPFYRSRHEVEVGDRLIITVKTKLDKKTFLPANSLATLVEIDLERGHYVLKFDRYHRNIRVRTLYARFAPEEK